MATDILAPLVRPTRARARSITLPGYRRREGAASADRPPKRERSRRDATRAARAAVCHRTSCDVGVSSSAVANVVTGGRL